MGRILFLGALFVLLSVGKPMNGSAADWGAYRADTRRSGHLPGERAVPSKLDWSVQLPQAPRPAWPPPARGSFWQKLEHIEARVIDDHAFHPIVAGGLLILGSSADDRVVALDADGGDLRWEVVTDGPVRYAPVVAGDSVYFGSDDGCVYAVSLTEGKIQWKQPIAPRTQWIPGNDRLISAWPVRTGLVVDNGHVYATAGLYPQQDAWICSLDANSGKFVWREKLDVSPQGYLLATQTMLIVPTGRSTPVGVDRETGRQVKTFHSTGGTFAVLSNEGSLFSGRGNDGTLAGVNVQTSEHFVSTQARQLVVTPDRSYMIDGGKLSALDRVRQSELMREIRDLEKEIRALQPRGGQAATDTVRETIRKLGQQLALANEALPRCVLWEVECAEDLALIATDNLVFAGGAGAVVAFQAENGARAWTHEVPGHALGLAVGESHWFVTTDTGMVIAFSAEQEEAGDSRFLESKRVSGVSGNQSIDDSPMSQNAKSVMDRWLDNGMPRLGYAMVVGLGSGRLVEQLVARTELRVIAVEKDRSRINELRRRWIDAGIYGSRVAIQEHPGGLLPFTDYFANVIVSETPWEGSIQESQISGLPADWAMTELRRILRPWGGWMWLSPKLDLERREALDGAGEWTHQFGNAANTSSSGDRRITGDLDLQWFGGPGPAVMVDRHLRAPAPLSSHGRLFVPGENRMLAVDAYNGTLLWERELPGSQRYTMPYDAGYMSLAETQLAVAVQGECWLLNTVDGAIDAKRVLPNQASEDSHWGYTALHVGGLFGSFQKPTASRTDASYQRIDVDYNNDQPLVTGLGFFRMDPETGRQVWLSQPGVILNTTITLSETHVIFVAAKAPELRDHSTGRILAAEFMKADPVVMALDIQTGQVVWEVPLDDQLKRTRNILYALTSGPHLVLTASWSAEDRDSHYQTTCLDVSNGELRWTAGHKKGAAGHTTHGEQVHHPVVMNDLLVCEPALYRLATGERIGHSKEKVTDAGAVAGDAEFEPWRLVRPGHSCGTLSGAGTCLFFRAGNPTVMDLHESIEGKLGTKSAKSLAPTRTGCWINIIPAGGLVMIPEASAGCVCNFSLQTSMAFRPRPRP